MCWPMLQIFSLSLWWWIQHITPRLWVQSPHRPFTKELDSMIFVRPLQLRISCESVKIDVTDISFASFQIWHTLGFGLFSIWLCVQRELFSAQHLHKNTSSQKQSKKGCKAWLPPCLMSSPQNPTTPHSQPVAQWLVCYQSNSEQLSRHGE